MCAVIAPPVLDWAAVASRAVEALGVTAGNIVNLRDHAGRHEVNREFVDAVRRAGGTLLVEDMPPEKVRRLLTSGNTDLLNAFAEKAVRAANDSQAVLVITGGTVALDGIDGSRLETWRRANHAVAHAQENLKLPYVAVAVPTIDRANSLGMWLDALDSRVIPALCAPVAQLDGEITRMLRAIDGAPEITIRSGEECELHLRLAPDRPWHRDDGLIDAGDRSRGAIVTNLPAGSVYTTVVEAATRGSIWFASAGPAHDVIMTFEGGRVTELAAVRGAEALTALLNGHTGEPRRVSHIGIGLNPNVQGFLGWTMFDEHRRGATFVALGENRYMGGQNQSSLNIDFVMHRATVAAGGRRIVERGKVVV